MKHGRGKIWAALAAVCILAALSATLAFAQAPEEDAPAARAGTVYQVGSTDALKQAFTDIAAQPETEATIVLTADIQNSSSADKKVGVDGKRITFQSQEGERHSLYVSSLAGDCIFDTVDFARRENLAANAYYLELTENFTSEIQNIYGVENNGSGKAKVIDKPVKMVLKGGSSAYITGTGSNISTTEDIHIVIDGHTVDELRGGASTPNGQSPYVQGDITIEVLSGEVTDTLYGGMWGHSDCPTNAKIEGDVHVIIGEEGSQEKTAVIGSLMGGGYFCAIDGDVDVTVNDGAYITENWGYGFCSAGEGCKVSGTVTTTINGGTVTAPLYIGGITHWDHWDGTNVEIGEKASVEAGPDGAKDVVKLIINGGDIGYGDHPGLRGRHLPARGQYHPGGVHRHRHPVL